MVPEKEVVQQRIAFAELLQNLGKASFDGKIKGVDDLYYLYLRKPKLSLVILWLLFLMMKRIRQTKSEKSSLDIP